MASPANAAARLAAAQPAPVPGPGEFAPQPRKPMGHSGARFHGFSRNQKGLPGFGGLDEFYALQNRAVPAFYSPTNPNQIPSAAQVAGQTQAMGGQINPNGGITNIGLNPMGGASVMQPPTAPGGSWIDRVMNGGFTPQQQAPAAPAPAGPDIEFQRRLAAARSAVEEGRRMQQMQEQQRLDSIQMTPTPGGGMSMRTPYGTASVSSRPPGGGTITDNGVKSSFKEWFRGAANRQGTPNKFAQPSANRVAAMTPRLAPPSAKFLNRIPRVGSQGQMLRS